MDQTAKQVIRRETIEWMGRTWTLTRATFDAMTRWSDFMEQRAIAMANRRRANLGDAGYKSMLGEINDRSNSGKYNWGSELSVEAMRGDDEAFKFAVYLIVAQSHPDLVRFDPNPAAEMTFERMFEQVGQQLTDAFVKINTPDPTPPAKQPATP